MRVGILGHGFVEWGGGIDFLRMVISSLHSSGDAVELHLLVPTRGPKLTAMRALRHAYRSAKSLAARATVDAPGRSAAHHLTDLANSADQPVGIHQIDIGAAAVGRAARALSVDALIPATTPLPPGFPVPWVGYIHDFQHRYFPQLFSQAECAQRDKHFATMLERARAVVVNARTVAEDIGRFHADAPARVFALPFSAAPQAAWLTAHESPAPKYGIEKPYFIICNQFWSHKDHATAFAAYARFAEVHPDIDLVCTGETSDYRDPDHFNRLQNALARDRVAHRVHILGMVPKTDQIALLKGSIALIQPTLFEGGPGGGAVYDAVSLGLRCLVSDIAVNRELAEAGVSFFRAGDPAALTELMATTVGRASEAYAPSAEALAARGRARRAACGARLIAALEYVRSKAREAMAEAPR